MEGGGCWKGTRGVEDSSRSLQEEWMDKRFNTLFGEAMMVEGVFLTRMRGLIERCEEGATTVFVCPEFRGVAGPYS